MLTLARMNGGSIYSLSANGGKVKGYMGLGPLLCAYKGAGCPATVRMSELGCRMSGLVESASVGSGA